MSNNFERYEDFFSTPKFISDLLYLSDILVPIEREKRNEKLRSVLSEINQFLPSNVYIPIDTTFEERKEGYR